MHHGFRNILCVVTIAALLLCSTYFDAFSKLSNIAKPYTAQAADQATIDQLQKNINDKNAQVAAINAEIKALDNQIQTTSAQSQTLKSTISTLEASRAKLLKDIDATQLKVSSASLTIEQLGLEINTNQKKIDDSRAALGNAIRNMSQAEDISLPEAVFSYKNVSDVWNEVEQLTRFQTGVRKNMAAVQILKDTLAQKKAASEAQKQNLIGLQGQLEDKKKIVETDKIEKAKLLSETQSQEALYKKQLDEKKKLAEAFQQELNAYESQLKFIIDPTSYPPSGSGVLKWPLQNVYITQKFGDTDFAKSTKAYNGKGHNGVDFRATPGTNIMAALDGTVEGIGNTDSVGGCYSYGKWILIRHDNGLSTLYAHLSLIKVSSGQRVKTGEVIAYSGYTGYVVPAGVAGAHLHFGVYASQGVKIVKYENSINCKNATIPVADLRAYLNPLLYL